jgi:hypothetical protein
MTEVCFLNARQKASWMLLRMCYYFIDLYERRNRKLIEYRPQPKLIEWTYEQKLIEWKATAYG